MAIRQLPEADHSPRTGISSRGMAKEKAPDGLWEVTSWFPSITHAKMTFISENTFLSLSLNHRNQAEQCHYHYVAERRSRCLTEMAARRYS